MDGTLCDNCKKNEATLHWTEVMAGTIFERHLCAECSGQELPYDLPAGAASELRFHCRCGQVVSWQIPRGVCEHGAGGYERAGRAEVEISTCECGVKFIAVTSRWRCSVCGAEALIQPREIGPLGYVYDHIYGPPKGEEIQIRGIIMP